VAETFLRNARPSGKSQLWPAKATKALAECLYIMSRRLFRLGQLAIVPPVGEAQ
ncbi:unnamed protein product, partial [marine sediment metagenome]